MKCRGSSRAFVASLGRAESEAACQLGIAATTGALCAELYHVGRRRGLGFHLAQSLDGSEFLFRSVERVALQKYLGQADVSLAGDHAEGISVALGETRAQQRFGSIRVAACCKCSTGVAAKDRAPECIGFGLATLQQRVRVAPQARKDCR